MTSSLFSQATVNFCCRVLGACLGLVLVALFARFSNIEIFARYTLVIAASAISVQLMQLGLPTALTKNVSIAAANNDKPEVKRNLVLVVCVFLGTASVFCFAAIVANVTEIQLMPVQGLVPVMFVIFCVLRVTQNIAVEFSRSIGNYRAYNATQILPQIISLSLCLALLHLEKDLTIETMLLCHVAGSISVIFAVGIVATGYLGDVKISHLPDIASISSILKLAVMLTGAAIATNSMREFSILWASNHATYEEIGSYGVAMRLVLVFSLGFKAVSSIIGPLIAAAISNGDMGSLRSIVFNAIKISVFYYLVSLLLIYFFGAIMVATIFGSIYAEANQLLLTLAGVTAVTIVSGPLGTILIMGGHHSRYAVYCIIAAAVSALLIIGMAPYFGIYSAVLAIFGFELALAIMSAQKVSKGFGIV